MVHCLAVWLKSISRFGTATLHGRTVSEHETRTAHAKELLSLGGWGPRNIAAQAALKITRAQEEQLENSFQFSVMVLVLECFTCALFFRVHYGKLPPKYALSADFGESRLCPMTTVSVLV